MHRSSLYDRPDLYDAILPPSAEMEAFYKGTMRRTGARVLELACGSGRFTIPLASAGHTVTGLDESASMLDRACLHASQAGVSIDFVAADMRTFALEGAPFDVIILPANSILHLLATEDVVAMLRAVARHLAPDGAFVFDAFVPSVQILSRDATERFPGPEGVHPELGRISVEETVRYDPAAQVSDIDWYWSRKEERDFLHTPFRLRQIFPQELPLLLAAGGLRLVDRFGDFDRSPFTAVSHRQVCVCSPA